MSLAQLSAAPRTPVELQAWSFANVAHHRDIIRRVFETRGLKLVEYPLEPFDPADAGQLANFLNLHEDMHEAMSRALGLDTYNLSDVDWQDPDDLARWTNQHYIAHQAAASVLGVS